MNEEKKLNLEKEIQTLKIKNENLISFLENNLIKEKEKTFWIFIKKYLIFIVPLFIKAWIEIYNGELWKNFNLVTLYDNYSFWFFICLVIAFIIFKYFSDKEPNKKLEELNKIKNTK